MAKPIIAYQVTVTEPELLNNYTNLFKAMGQLSGTKNARQEKLWGDRIEETLAKYYGGRVSEQAAKNVAGVPDLQIESPRIAKALSRILGTDEQDILQPEVKAKRGSKYGSTIGQAAYSGFNNSLLDAIKLQATEAEQTGLLRQDKDFGKVGKQSFDVNNPEEVLKAARAKVGGPGFFKLIRDNDPELHMQFYNKAKNLLISKANIVKGKVTSVNVINIFFPKTAFTSPPFVTELKKNNIQYNLSSTFEKNLINQLTESGAAVTASSLEEFQKVIEKIDGKRKTSTQTFKNAPSLDFEILFGVPTGGSIPRVAGKIKRGNVKRRESVKDTGRFISSIQLTTILRNKIEGKMPRIGDPNPTEGLKYRTGKFVNSLQFIVDYKKSLISYYADPPVSQYFDKFHSRPYAVGQRLIRPTIRQTAQELFGRQFRIIRT